MDVPEISRCSWAVVQLRADGWPCKAIFGSLPGVQTVARAERYAGLVATCLSSQVEVLISDHLSFVQEGQRWGPSDASSSARHAALWRALRATVAKQGRRPPSFGWIPSHKAVDQAFELGFDIQDWVGNCWADLFASVALDLASPARGLARSIKFRMEEACQNARFLGWASARVAGSGVWDPREPDPRRPKMETAPRVISFIA